MKAAKTWVLIVLLLTPAIDVHAWPIPDTGQTKCYNNTVEIIPCPSPGEPFYGQDGNYTINPPSYTKLGDSGKVLPDDAETWIMIRDNVTGLIWENKTNDGSIHDAYKMFFTWCDRTSGGNQGTCGSGSGASATDTDAFIRALNNNRFGGFSDWRMPTVKELMTIADRSRASPAVNTDWFPNMGSLYYWSSATNAGDNAQAWCVIFSDGNVVYDSKSSSNTVRAVRGGQPENRYTDNGDGTVSDTATGLMWQREAAGAENWQAALNHAATLPLDDYDDWRLPNVNEIQSLVDYSRYNPSIDATAFPGTGPSGYWSSTTYAGDYENAWSVDFNQGFVSHYNKLNAFNVRAVRGGQSRLLGHLVISAPAQAARWGIGKQKTIAWDKAGVTGQVKITISRQGGKQETFNEIIAASVPNNGSFNWTVTDPESVNCALRIEPIDLPMGTTQSLFSITAIIAGDINGDKAVDLTDAILAIRAMSRMTPPGQTFNMDADVNGDGKMSLPEAIFILQKVAGMR